MCRITQQQHAVLPTETLLIYRYNGWWNHYLEILTRGECFGLKFNLITRIQKASKTLFRGCWWSLIISVQNRFHMEMFYNNTHRAWFERSWKCIGKKVITIEKLNAKLSKEPVTCLISYTMQIQVFQFFRCTRQDNMRLLALKFNIIHSVNCDIIKYIYINKCTSNT